MPTASKTWPLAPAPAASGEALRIGVSLICGAAFTAGLFFLVARYLHSRRSEPTETVEDLRQVYLATPPPPPPDPAAVPLPPDTSFVGFDLAPTDSPVKIAVSPPIFHIDSPEQLAPAAHIHIGIFEGVFKPKMRQLDNPNHVYQLSEVDQRPTALYREKFNVPYDIIKSAKRLRVVLIFVVQPDGTTGQIRVKESSGNPDYDSLVAEHVADWTFNPGIKHGKKVRTLMEEAVVGRVDAGNPFHY